MPLYPWFERWCRVFVLPVLVSCMPRTVGPHSPCVVCVTLPHNYHTTAANISYKYNITKVCIVHIIITPPIVLVESGRNSEQVSIMRPMTLKNAFWY